MLPPDVQAQLINTVSGSPDLTSGMNKIALFLGHRWRRFPHTLLPKTAPPAPPESLSSFLPGESYLQNDPPAIPITQWPVPRLPEPATCEMRPPSSQHNLPPPPRLPESVTCEVRPPSTQHNPSHLNVQAHRYEEIPQSSNQAPRIPQTGPPPIPGTQWPVPRLPEPVTCAARPLSSPHNPPPPHVHAHLFEEIPPTPPQAPRIRPPVHHVPHPPKKHRRDTLGR